jgi:hypothetical protein
LNIPSVAGQESKYRADQDLLSASIGVESAECSRRQRFLDLLWILSKDEIGKTQ